MTPQPRQSSSAVRQVVEAHMEAEPRIGDLTEDEREMVASALEGAATTVVAMLSRVTALCDSSTTGMVSVAALKAALSGESSDA